MSTMNLTKRRVTLYFRNEFGFGYSQVEASAYSVTVGPWAQYPSAVFVEFLAKGARRSRGFVQSSHVDVVIVDGWNNFEPDGIYLPAVRDEALGVETREGRHSACSPLWDSEFRAKLSASGASIVLDMKGYNAHSPFIGPAAPTPADRYRAEQAAAIAHEYDPSTERCRCGEQH